MMPPDSVLADFMSELDLQISVMLYGLAPATLDEAIMKAKMIEIGQRNAVGTMQFNAKVAQLEQENALLHQQLEWQPRPPQSQMSQPQPQQQQTQRLPQNQVVKLQWKPFGKPRPKGRGFNPPWNRKQLDNQPPNSNQNDKGNLRCHGCGQKGHFRKDCLAEGSNMNHLTEESDKEEEVDINNNHITPKSILKKPEVEDSQVNLKRDSNPYQYDIVNDFRWTPTNTFFGDLVQIPKYRESLQQYLTAVERKNQREVKNTTLKEKPVY